MFPLPLACDPGPASFLYLMLCSSSVSPPHDLSPWNSCLFSSIKIFCLFIFISFLLTGHMHVRPRLERGGGNKIAWLHLSVVLYNLHIYHWPHSLLLDFELFPQSAYPVALEPKIVNHSAGKEVFFYLPVLPTPGLPWDFMVGLPLRFSWLWHPPTPVVTALHSGCGLPRIPNPRGESADGEAFTAAKHVCWLWVPRLLADTVQQHERRQPLLCLDQGTLGLRTLSSTSGHAFSLP